MNLRPSLSESNCSSLVVSTSPLPPDTPKLRNLTNRTIPPPNFPLFSKSHPGFSITALLFGSNGGYYNIFAAHNEPQMYSASNIMSRICHKLSDSASITPLRSVHPKSLYLTNCTIPLAKSEGSPRKREQIRQLSPIKERFKKYSCPFSGTCLTEF